MLLIGVPRALCGKLHAQWLRLKAWLRDPNGYACVIPVPSLATMGSDHHKLSSRVAYSIRMAGRARSEETIQHLWSALYSLTAEVSPCEQHVSPDKTRRVISWAECLDLQGDAALAPKDDPMPQVLFCTAPSGWLSTERICLCRTGCGNADLFYSVH